MRVLWIALTSLAALGHGYAFDPEGTPAADGAPPKEVTGEIVNEPYGDSLCLGKEAEAM